MVSTFVATLSSPCPAGVTQLGASCGGTSLQAVTAPWAGAGYTSRGLGFAPNALVLAVTGLAPTSVSLPSLLPQALPGCQLSAAPDVLSLLANNGGEATFTFLLPNDPTIAGQTFDQQFIAFELDASLAITSIASTNGLQATVGAF